jgi:hypothetical protein
MRIVNGGADVQIVVVPQQAESDAIVGVVDDLLVVDGAVDDCSHHRVPRLFIHVSIHFGRRSRPIRRRLNRLRIMRDMRNSVNRLVNCETANLNKTIGAAVRQIENIRLLDREIGLDKLPAKLREVAEIRLQHPDMNLKEVGEMIGGVSKSGVNHRLRKLDEMAEKLRSSGQPARGTADSAKKPN